MQIIPAIDIIDGKCVRLSKGDYSQKTIYRDNPVDVASELEQAGIKRLHLVDLDGAKAKQVVNLKVLQEITSRTTLKVDFGGGVQSTEDLQRVFEAGASQITGGSIAVKNPELFISWLEQYGPEKIILGADVHDRKVAVSGWQEQSAWDLFDFIDSYVKKNIKYVICTDVSKDGMLQGPAVDLYSEMTTRYPELSIIASGGVSCYQDLELLTRTGVTGVIVGKAIYEGKISMDQLAEFTDAD